ncbi:MAG: YkgJ family cysteine cluster protein [Acidobacteriota bacterium]
MSLPTGDRRLVQIMDTAFAEAQRRAGSHLVCRPGCTQCCHGPFAINALDAARLRAGMEALDVSDPERAHAIRARAEAWIREFARVFPGNPDSGALAEPEADCDPFEEIADESACPALDPVSGCCDVYAWRPMTCRVFGPPVRMETGALGCCELCFTTADVAEIAACEMPVPHELESELLAEMNDTTETVVAYALLKPRTEEPE